LHVSLGIQRAFKKHSILAVKKAFKKHSILAVKKAFKKHSMGIQFQRSAAGFIFTRSWESIWKFPVAF
jgi:hypothetical protein